MRALRRGPGPCARVRALRRAQGRVRACVLSGGRRAACAHACSPAGACLLSGGRWAVCAHACSLAGAGPRARMRALRRAQGRVHACMLFGGSRENCVQKHPREGRSNRGSGERARSTSVSRAQRRAQGQTGPTDMRVGKDRTAAQGGGDWASSTDVTRSREGPPQTHRTAAQHLKRTLPANGKHGYWDQ